MQRWMWLQIQWIWFKRHECDCQRWWMWLQRLCTVFQKQWKNDRSMNAIAKIMNVTAKKNVITKIMNIVREMIWKWLQSWWMWLQGNEECVIKILNAIAKMMNAI